MTKEQLCRQSLQFIHQTIYGDAVSFPPATGIASQDVGFFPAVKTVDGYRQIGTVSKYYPDLMSGSLINNVPIDVVHWTIASATGVVAMIDQWNYGFTTYMRP